MFEDEEPHDNYILSWTFSPQSVIDKYEHRTPSLKVRVAAAKKVAQAGWSVRVNFDPILCFEGWESEYGQMAKYVVDELGEGAIRDVSIGPFRMNKEYLKNARNRASEVLFRGLEQDGEGVYTYSTQIKVEIGAVLQAAIQGVVSKGKIVVW